MFQLTALWIALLAVHHDKELVMRCAKARISLLLDRTEELRGKKHEIMTELGALERDISQTLRRK